MPEARTGPAEECESPGGRGRSSFRRGSALLDAVVAASITALLLIPLLEGMVAARRLASRAEGGLLALRKAESCLEALRAARGSFDPRALPECQDVSARVNTDGTTWLRRIEVRVPWTGSHGGGEVVLLTLAE